ncbi:hypothetical protein XELAEV_18000716mg [Xenopus laevis]|uniref:Uncharacterized protein n=1 Tax=Xenopus laevis TaxID=8355 RepID=A0A974BNW3_XENLA|nr:hypothetical protein XELAEV_18000716mg [Xenopus laevis]
MDGMLQRSQRSTRGDTEGNTRRETQTQGPFAYRSRTNKCYYINEHQEQQQEQKKCTRRGKRRSWTPSQVPKMNPIYNLSHHTLTPAETSLLSKGTSFVTTVLFNKFNWEVESFKLGRN